jgi:thiol-disulfide isomerase/thioredoxin
MLKKINIILIALIYVSCSCFAGELQINPQSPTIGSVINVKYFADGRFFVDENLSLRVYAFTSNSTNPTAYEFSLSYNKVQSFYFGNFTVPDETVFILMKVASLEHIDNNSGEFWDLLFSSNEKPLRNTNLKAGLSYLGNLPENLNRNIDFKKAIYYLQKEIENYPDNVPAQIGLASLQLDLQKIDYKEYSAKVEKIIKTSYDKNNEAEVRAISRALKTLNKKDEAEKLEKDFIKKFPQSNLAEEIFMADLAKANSLEKFSDGILEYLKKFNDVSNRERIYSALVSGYLQVGKADEVIELLNKQNDVPSGAYAQIAFALVNNDEFSEMTDEYKLQKAKNLMNISIYGIKQNNLNNKPDYITISEWELRNKIRLATLLEQYGQILMAAQEYEEAYNKYAEALDVYKNDAPVSLYENVVKLCMILGKYQTAYNIAELSVKNSKDSEVIIDFFEQLHKQLNKSETFDVMLIALKNEARNERLKKLSYSRLNKDIQNITFVDLNGKRISLKELNGKVIVLMLWSSWCGPCDDALKGFYFLSDAYADSSDVIIASVNLWENAKDVKKTVKDYFAESDVKFKIWIDDTNALPFEAGITGLPSVCFIGKNGKIEFIDRGFTNNDEFLLNSKDKVSLISR